MTEYTREQVLDLDPVIKQMSMSGTADLLSW